MSNPLNSFGRNRHCGNCQAVLPEQSIFKRSSCHKCRAGVPLCLNKWDENGWGRCPLCFCFFHRTHLYCEVCGWANQVGFGLKRKREQEAHKLERQAKARRIAELEAENERLKAQLKNKDEEEDAFLSSIDEEMLSSPQLPITVGNDDASANGGSPNTDSDANSGSCNADASSVALSADVGSVASNADI